MKRQLEAMNRAALASGLAMVPLVHAFERFGRQLYAAVRQGYLNAGAPYGDTHEGLMKWVREQKPEV